MDFFSLHQKDFTNWRYLEAPGMEVNDHDMYAAIMAVNAANSSDYWLDGRTARGCRPHSQAAERSEETEPPTRRYGREMETGHRPICGQNHHR